MLIVRGLQCPVSTVRDLKVAGRGCDATDLEAGGSDKVFLRAAGSYMYTLVQTGKNMLTTSGHGWAKGVGGRKIYRFPPFDVRHL